MITLNEILDASILVVDDQAANVELLQLLLSSAGYGRVTVTTQAAQVCAMHAEHQYDLILLDLKMPHMDGFAVMEGLKDGNPDSYLPVIVLTAEPAYRVRALECGAKDFISKPFDVLEVKVRIHNMLEVRLLHKQLARHKARLEQEVQERTAMLRASEASFQSLASLASDWYWEQNAAGDSATVSGPVAEILGLRVTAFFGNQPGATHSGWDDGEREALQAVIAAREPFRDFAFSRVNSDGSRQQFRVSGEPMLDSACRFVGFRGIGVEATAAR